MNFDILPCGVLELNNSHNVIQVNREFLEYGKFSEKDIKGKRISELPFLDVNKPESKPVDFTKCFSGNKTQLQKSAMMRKNDGTLLLVFMHGRKVSENKYLITVCDISREIACSLSPLSKFSIKGKSPLDAFVGTDEKILNIHRLIELASESSSNVMISGESGTGKELVANAIHALSPRKEKPFIKVNCAAIPETLLESELFGHVKGSFTGAYKDKIGKFEAAHGGTVFLDEIGEISPMIQVKLLRAIQEKTIEKVGDNKVVNVNMRIIAATNKNLRDQVNKGLFREDLFYRLNVFPIITVPLREHKNDIPTLSEHFIEKFNLQTGKHIKGLTEDAYRMLMDYCWPGNVRELENCIEHAFVLCNSRLIDIFDLPQDVRLVNLRQGLCKGIESTTKPAYFYSEPHIPVSVNNNPKLPIQKNIDKEQLLAFLHSNSWNRNETAKQLGISRVSLWKKMKKFGI